MRETVAAAALLALAVATAARAGEERALTLTRGVDYAVSARTEGTGGDRLQVLDPAGRVLREVAVDRSVREGFEFRPGVTATYFFRTLDGPGAPAPNPGNIGVTRDCRGGVSTLCTLQVGVAAASTFDFLDEFDFHRVRLVAGRRYTAALAREGAGAGLLVAFVDGRRRTLRSSGAAGAGPDGRALVQVSFTPRRTGDYWVKAVGGARTGAYEVLVRQGR
jgi:hypothetical protein